MQLDRRDIKLQNPHVLHNQCINAGFIQAHNQLLRRFQLIIMQNRIQGNEDFCAIAMGKRHQVGNILQAIAGIMPRAKSRTTDINGVSAMENGFTGNRRIAGGAKKFKMSVLRVHTVGIIQ